MTTTHPVTGNLTSEQIAPVLFDQTNVARSDKNSQEHKAQIEVFNWPNKGLNSADFKTLLQLLRKANIEQLASIRLSTESELYCRDGA